MPPRKTTSSQNSQANDGVPLSLEGLPPMNAEKGFISISELSLVWLSVKLELLRLMVRDNPHLLGVAPLMTLRN